MASRMSDKKRSLRNRDLTCTRSLARNLKYLSPEVDFPALERELKQPTPTWQVRSFGGAR